MESVKKNEDLELRNLSLDDVICETKGLSNNHITNKLFEMIRNRLLNYKNGIDFNTLFNITNYMKEVLDLNPSINRKSIMKKIKGVYAKIEDISLDNNVSDTVKSRLIKFRKNLENLEDYIMDAEPNSYKFILDAIATRNIEYLERTFKSTKSMANAKDKNGASLLKNICSRYIKCIGTIEEHKDDLTFYDNLLNILMSCNATLTFDEKKNLLRMIKAHIEALSTKDSFYDKKVFYLNNLYKILTEDHRIKSEVLEELSKKYNVNVIFTKELLDSIRLIKSNCDLPYLDTYIMSIDSPNTKMFDDAISCDKLSNGNFLLGVHITDILSYFPINSGITKEALNRSFPIYIDKTTKFNMFPDEITKDICSLKEGEVRPVRSYFFEITGEGEIIREKVIKSKIINRENVSFKDVNDMIRRGNTSVTLSNLLSLINAKGKDKADYIVSYIASLTNNEVGKYLHDNSYPGVYLKIKEEKDEKDLYTKLKENKRAFDSKDYKHLMDSLSAAPIRTEYGLEPDYDGNSFYTNATITSPLRKASDILNMYAMDICYFDNPSIQDVDKLGKFLEEKVEHINAQKDNIDRFTREYNNQKVNILK